MTILYFQKNHIIKEKNHINAIDVQQLLAIKISCLYMSAGIQVYSLSNCIFIKMTLGEKPFKCDLCQSAFSHKYPFTLHKRIHTGFDLEMLFLGIFKIIRKQVKNPINVINAH